MTVQYVPNPALWLAIQEDKMALSCPLRLSAVSRKKEFPEIYIINPLLTKLVRSWLHYIGLVRLCEFIYGPRLHLGPLVNIQPSWTNNLGQQPTYIFPTFYSYPEKSWLYGNLNFFVTYWTFFSSKNSNIRKRRFSCLTQVIGDFLVSEKKK